jgi:serine/threonine-protein kinase HipA
MSEVDVIVQIAGEDVLAGRLWFHRRRGRESATFAYAADYLAREDAYELDPGLPLVAGPQQTAVGRAIFGAFADCAPDRWGRRLIQRTERRRALREEATERSLGEGDYLLGVRDDLRQGALRFRDIESGTYLADEQAGVPDLIELPALLRAAESMERDEADEGELRRLLHGGSSLGGARPKAHVIDREGRLGIAKFPRPTDDWDVTRWEVVVLELARAAGVWVPPFERHEVDGKAVLIVDRFDRDGDLRIGYVSAMTMLEAGDGEVGSYLDIAETIEVHSAQTDKDLRQLWRRIAFSVLVSNTDDHLRNHGFLRTSTAGWSLSPAFDLNPDPEPGPKTLSTAIDYDTDAASLEVLFDVAEHFRLGDEEAEAIAGDVAAATRDWCPAAERAGIERSEIERMAPAFEHEQAERARSIVAA